jgi:uncharacterized protein YeaC (DUF1315 family)
MGSSEQTYESGEWEDGTSISFGREAALKAAMLWLAQEEGDHI